MEDMSNFKPSLCMIGKENDGALESRGQGSKPEKGLGLP